MPLENVSLGGAFVRTEAPLPVGTAVAMELLDGSVDKPLKVTGRVAGVVSPAQAKEHGRAAGMGVQFDPLPVDAHARLQKLIKALTAKAGRGGAVVDESMQQDRANMFDFGFATLDVSEEATPPEEPAPQPEPVRRAARPPPPKPPEPPPKPKRRNTGESWLAPPRGEKVEVRVAAPDHQIPVPADQKLMVQVRGLLLELSDAQDALRRSEREVDALKAEVARLRAELDRKR